MKCEVCGQRIPWDNWDPPDGYAGSDCELFDYMNHLKSHRLVREIPGGWQCACNHICNRDRLFAEAQNLYEHTRSCETFQARACLAALAAM